MTLDLRKAIILIITGVALTTLLISAAVIDYYPNKGALAFTIAVTWIYLFMRANRWFFEGYEAEEDEEI